MLESSSPVFVALSDAVPVTSAVEFAVTVTVTVPLKKPPHAEVGVAVASALAVCVPEGKLHEQNVEAMEKGPLERFLRRLQ